MKRILAYFGIGVFFLQALTVQAVGGWGLWSAGDGFSGQLGDGAGTNANSPLLIVGSNVVFRVAAGGSHAVFIKTDGSLWGMGDNTYGELGYQGGSTGASTPGVIETNGVVEVAAGYDHTLYVKNDGSLWAVGYEVYGQLGDGSYGVGHNYYTNVPEMILSNGVSKIAAGEYHSLFIETNGSLWAMGNDLQWQLGNNQQVSTNTPQLIVSSNVTAIAAGWSHSLFIESDGSLWGMGYNYYGALGLGTNPVFKTPTPIDGNVATVAAGANFTLYVKKDGTLWATGDNSEGQFGNGTTNSTITPVQVPVSNVVAVAAGTYTSAFLKSDGSVWTAGYNLESALGAGFTNVYSTVPLEVVSSNVTAIAYAADSLYFLQTVIASVQVGTPAIGLSGDLNFGVIGIGFSKQSMLTISNSGSGLLTVSNIEAPSGFGVSWSNGVIAAGATQPVTVTFSPSVANNYVGSIIVSSDAASGTPAIETSGFGANNSLVLTVLTSGSGTVTPNLNGKLLHAKTKYTLKAVPSKTSVFVGWNGSIVTNKNPLTFTMESNTIFEAIFEANPFLAYKGVFNGLFYSTNGVTEQTAGLLKNLSVASTGSYSASMLLNGATLPVHGAFSLDGQSTVVLHRSAAQGGNVTVNLQLTTNNIIPQVVGSVAGANGLAVWTASLVDNLATNVIPSKELTMLIPPDTNNQPPLLSPGGDGYALITNSAGTVKNPASANVKLTGALADGTPYNESTTVASDGSVPVYANLYGGKGLLLGWINLNLTNTAAVSNEFLTWIHPVEKAGLYKSGFTNFVSSNQVMISAWTNPLANLAEFTNLSLFGSVANTNSAGDIPTLISSTGKITGSEVIGTLAVKTGLVKLTVGTGAQKVSATGALLLNDTTGGGYFLTKTNAQGLLINP